MAIPTLSAPDRELRRQLINQLGLLAHDLDTEAELYRLAGGGWGLMLADEVRRGAAHLRFIACTMILDEKRPVSNRHALDWIRAAQSYITLIKEANGE